MNLRMTKYYDETETKNSRYHKNEELYNEISKSDLEHYDIKSNATILGENKNEIDIEKIKKILDNRYKDVNKRHSIRIEEEEISEEKEVTKEYDINVILEKARENKVENYEEERLKKLRDTQYDILNNLKLEQEDSLPETKEDDDDLKRLINTIALNEKETINDSSPLDILSDLKGSDDTEVLEGLKESCDEKLKEDEKKEFDTKMINSFYTSSNALKEKDFEDIDDFANSIESNNVFLKIVIALVVIVFIVGLVLIIKSVYFS